MDNTPETRAALERIAATVAATGTGYKFTIRGYGDDYITASICPPNSTPEIIYPEIYFNDDYFGDSVVTIDIITAGYSDHSISQARRVVAGLQVAIGLCDMLYAMFEAAGFKTRRE